MFTQVSVILKLGSLKHFGKLILVTSIISEPISQHDLIPLYRIWSLKKKKKSQALEFFRFEKMYKMN